MRDETLQRDQSGMVEARESSLSPDEPQPGGQELANERAEPATAAGPFPATAAPPAAELPTAEPATVWPAETARGFRDRWRDIQLRFVDDPRGATNDAEALLAEVLKVFSETLAAHKAEVDTWGDAEGADVERLRTAVRRYRDLLERLLGM